jgi:hypothetical protein
MVMRRLPFEYALPEDKDYKLLMSGEDPSSYWAARIDLLIKLEAAEHSMVEEFKDLFLKMVRN